MKLGDLQALAEDRARLKRATQLAAELTRLDAKRAGIVAELQGLGIEPDEDGIPREGRSGTAREAPGAGMRDRALSKPGAIGVQPAAPHSWDEAYAVARERIVGPWLKDFENGILGSAEGVIGDAEERLRDYEARRRPDIEAMAREILAGGEAAAPCVRCAAAATTTIAGVAYCTAHAAEAPRPERPALSGIAVH